MEDGSAPPPVRVLVVDDISRVVRDHETLGRAAEDIVICGLARTPAALLEEARRLQPDVILLNEAYLGVDLTFAVHELMQIVPAASVIELSTDPGRAEQRHRKVGVAAFVHSDIDLDEMVGTIRRLRNPQVAPTEPEDPVQPVVPRRIRRGAKSKAEVFFVFAGKGGVGKSMVATNLAVALADERDAKVAIIDLDLQYGDVGILLGVQGEQSIDSLAEQGEQLDAEMLEDVMVDGPGGIRVMLGPPSPELADLVTAAMLRAILRELSRTYDYVVIDGPAHLEERTLEVIELADQVLVITSFNVTAVKDTKVTLKVLSSLGIDKERISVVLNQTRAKLPFSREEVEESLRFRVVTQLPFDPRVVDESLDNGKPFVLTEPKAEITRQLITLVDFLSPPGEFAAGADGKQTDKGSSKDKDREKVSRRRFSLGRS